VPRAMARGTSTAGWPVATCVHEAPHALLGGVHRVTQQVCVRVSMRVSGSPDCVQSA
jgi:hypothetical protein